MICWEASGVEAGSHGWPVSRVRNVPQPKHTELTCSPQEEERAAKGTEEAEVMLVPREKWDSESMESEARRWTARTMKDVMDSEYWMDRLLLLSQCCAVCSSAAHRCKSTSVRGACEAWVA